MYYGGSTVLDRKAGAVCAETEGASGTGIIYVEYAKVVVRKKLRGRYEQYYCQLYMDLIMA